MLSNTMVTWNLLFIFNVIMYPLFMLNMCIFHNLLFRTYLPMKLKHAALMKMGNYFYNDSIWDNSKVQCHVQLESLEKIIMSLSYLITYSIQVLHAKYFRLSYCC